MALKELPSIYEKMLKKKNNKNKKIKSLLGSDLSNSQVNIRSKYGQQKLS